MRLLALLFLLTASCGKQDETPSANSDAKAEAPVAPAAPKAPPAAPPPSAKAFKVEEKTDLYTFSFAWPAEAAAIPQLAERFKAEMAKSKAELTRDASKDRDERKEGGFPFHAYELQPGVRDSGPERPASEPGIVGLQLHRRRSWLDRLGFLDLGPAVRKGDLDP
jgi:hypothetical protein